ncbi:hypothetical protein B0H63DRAFT_77808 [Podospora didyma]|uniref:Uncharacterized protein n=1 Tax=Podospora didyma TaxID=330526 RepID=A0AAE0K217_9PEZI|nr:hypothetical protein B0H63DRAFT_77808 [Podospora didyma]
MALRLNRVLAPSSRARSINRAPPLQRPFLVLSTFSLLHPLRSAPTSHLLRPLRSAPTSSSPSARPLAPSPAARQPNVARAPIPISPGWMPPPCPLWCPLDARRRLANLDILSVYSAFRRLQLLARLWSRPRVSSPFRATRLVSPCQRHLTSSNHLHSAS